MRGEGGRQGKEEKIGESRLDAVRSCGVTGKGGANPIDGRGLYPAVKYE